MGPGEIDSSSGADLEQLVSVSSERVKDDSRQTSPNMLSRFLGCTRHRSAQRILLAHDVLGAEQALVPDRSQLSSSIDPGTLSNAKASVVEERQLRVDERFHAFRSIPEHVGEMYSSLVQEQTGSTSPEDRFLIPGILLSSADVLSHDRSTGSSCYEVLHVLQVHKSDPCFEHSLC